MTRNHPDYKPKSGADLHRSWLELVDTDGPFLSIPALKEVWDQGMPPISSAAKVALADAKPPFEKAWEAWDRARSSESKDHEKVLTGYREARDLWVASVLTDVLGWGDNFIAGSTVTALSPDHAVTLTASGSLGHDGKTGALVLVVDPVDSLRDPLTDGWAISPIERMEVLLRAADVPIGLVTDGRWWAIVNTRTGIMPSSGIVDAQTWIEEPATTAAFVALLQRQRLIGGNPEERLPEIFAASIAAAEEITEALGVQIRQAVELLVQAMSESGEPRPDDAHQVYEASVTVMMRVVFLLFAEERGLLPASDLFTLGYGMSDQLDNLDNRARDEGAESLDATHLTWHRLLATSQALFAGATFEDIRLPSYGGSLFDPTRFPFLLDRTEQGTLAVTISDRVMLEVLRAVQTAKLKGESRRISFRDIDVEQIGYIYEGLLGYSCSYVDEVTVGLLGKDGLEPEITLSELEDLEALHQKPEALYKALADYVKETQPAAKIATKATLVKALKNPVEDAERALRAATTDSSLRERLLPFVGIIRRDLRDRPLVVMSGGLVVIETPSRATSGAHYTPKSLAEEVVEHALEPLVFHPGPHQTPDRDKWKPLSSDQILELKVADIACGSGAFLVAAGRYLSARLVEAWQREGVATLSARELRVQALRDVVANCLYGADINDMAVEMCKLSLWLVSLDPKLPFSFVDDKVLLGNSLLGLTDAKQLERLHIDPSAASNQLSVLDLDVPAVLEKAARLRRSLATEVDDSDPMRSTTTKRRQWREYAQLVSQLTHVADGVVAAGLTVSGQPGKALNEAYDNLRISVEQAYGNPPNGAMLDAIIERGLTPTVPTDYRRWHPLHWILAVPDVMERGGFDALIGNPPFLGAKKITPASGQNVREWLVHQLADGTKGNADLVAYFYLRALSLLSAEGKVGLIATNSIAQGDTREVGLDQMVARGFTITRSIQSRAWPASSANLEFAAVWGAKGTVSRDAELTADGIAAKGISPLLEPQGRVTGAPIRLRENFGIAFQGCIVLGKGFVISPDQASSWLRKSPPNGKVLRPYLVGDDINSRPDSSPTRWVIDMEERSEAEARRFVLPFEHLASTVLPERATKDAEKYPRMVHEWWKFWNSRTGMRRAIQRLDEYLAIARLSASLMPMRVPIGAIPSEQVVVFALNGCSDQAVLSSTPHQLWVVQNGSTFGTGPRYSTSNVFETFPRPNPTDELAGIGRTLDTERREIMLRRDLGLTKLYNLVNDPDIKGSDDADIARLREIHVELDQAVMSAYGWQEVPLYHGFHTYRQMERWTVSPEGRIEILDRLLEENHRRAALQDGVPEAADEDELEEDDE